jgi:uncharacterized protein (DUF1501 family)
MAITRRQFIKRSGLVTAGTLLGPGLFGNVLMQRAYAALEDNNRYFVVIFLDGGNDGSTPSPRTTCRAPRRLRCAREQHQHQPEELARQLDRRRPDLGHAARDSSRFNVPTTSSTTARAGD